MNENHSRLELVAPLFDLPNPPPERDSSSVALGEGMPVAGQAISLADLPRGVEATVIGVKDLAQPADRELKLRMIEIGFVPGETVRVIAHGSPGREPIAVRLGATTFALRRFEAGLVRVAAHARARSR